jgi:hypothetical protein
MCTPTGSVLHKFLPGVPENPEFFVVGVICPRSQDAFGTTGRIPSAKSSLVLYLVIKTCSSSIFNLKSNLGSLVLLNFKNIIETSLIIML